MAKTAEDEIAENTVLDISNLENGLRNLKGSDHVQAEREARKNGETMPEISFSKDFQARLAAKALNVSRREIMELPIQDFASVTTRVSNFLFGNLLTEIGKNVE